ncbi:YDG domain-containing protein [Flavobacterium sp. XGLA_31]|uniref:YDG domain-containing protein n=1 Tax=Flavobacterium sp. XGLA_31 TaxID=3447666 RepID=UPI003F307EC5
MKNILLLKNARLFHVLSFALFLLVIGSGKSFAQTTFFFYQNTTATIPTGWVLTNNVTANAIDKSTYLHLEAGNPSDQIVTPNYDLTGYTNVTLAYSVATFGTVTANPALKVEVSTNGGTSWSATTYTSSAPTSSTYVNGTISITGQTFTSTTKFRFSNTLTSGTGLRNQNLKLTGSLPAVNPTFASYPNVSKTYGDAGFSMVASSDSPGAISYTSTNSAVATINSSTGAVTIKGVGSTTIIANQAAATGYNAGSTSATLTVAQATTGLTITANNVTKSYGTTLSNGSSSNFSVSGLLYTDSLGTGATVTNTYGAGASGTAAPGSYVGSIVPSALVNGTGATYNSANYAATTYVNGDITVNQASQTISLTPSVTKTYGDAAYTLNGVATSGLTVSYSSSNTAVATVSGNTVTIVGAGTTTITASQAGDANYSAATSVTQTLTVNVKNLNVTGITANSKYYDGNTTATLSGTAVLSGVVGTDDVTLTGTPTAVFVSSSVGTGITVNVTGYAITGAAVANYLLVQPTALSADIIANTPTLFASGTLSAVSTTYGTASGTTSFSLSAQSLNEGVHVSAPAGFEVSDGGAYATAITVGGAGSLSATTINVRLAATTAAGTYSGNVTLSSDQATTITVATVSSTVSPKGLTISGLTGVDKTYDGTTAASVTGIATLNGVVGSDDVTPNGTSATYNFVTATAGTNKSITVLGFTLNGASAANYTVAQPTGITATINKAASSIAVTGALTFTYNGTAQGPNTSSVTGSTGAIAYSYNGVSPTVYGPSATRPTNAGNYTVVATVAADTNYESAASASAGFTIAKADQTITLAATDTKTTNTTTYTLALNASSGLAVSYSSSNTAVATVSGNTVTIVGIGTTTITANQAGDANYNAAPQVTQTLTVTQGASVLAGWDFFGQSSPATFAATTYNTNLNNTASQSTMTRGAGAASSSGSNSFRTVGFQNNGISTSNTDYFEVKATAVAGKTLTLTRIDANLIGTNTFYASPGVTSQFAYSLNGSTFTLIGSPVTTTSLSINFDLTGITALQNVPAGTTVTLRYYASGQTSTGGWGFSSPAAGTNGLALTGYTSLQPAPSITSALTASGTVGAAFSYATTATNSPSSYAASGLPSGLSINTTSGAITGTPTVAGTFNVSLSATNLTGTDTKTLVVTIAKANQTISLTSSVTKTYGDAAYTLNGVATSGLTVSYSSSNTAVATVSGNTVTIVGAGSATITASQAGDDNYNAATAVDQALVVNKANQTITFAALSPKNDVDGPYTLAATASSGLAVSYSSSNTSVLTISGNTVTIVAPGTSVITASQAGNDNYNAAVSVDQEQNIINTSLANQTITFGALSPVTYGDAPFALTGSVNSSLTITYTSSNPAVASVSGNTVTIHAPGTTTITASQDGDSTHNPAQDVAQSLVVAKKGLNAVNVSVANKTYDGTTAATLTADLDGVVGTDDVTLSNAAAFATANVGTGIAVTANLSISGAQADRYVLSQPSGLSADILMADQVISFDPLADKTYGDAPFTVSATGGASGAPIVFTSSDPLIATVSGTTVTIVGVGTVTITASQAGDSNYNAAADVSQTFTVNKANQTITFNALVNRTTADTTFTLNGFSSSALSVVYSSSNPAVATIVGNVVTVVGPGSTTITASQPGNDFYNAAADVAQTQLVLTAIAKWTFEGVTIATPGSTAVITAGSAVADQGLQTSGSLFSSTHASTATIWSTPAGNGSTKSATSDHWAVGDYYQFKVNTSDYHDLAIAFDQTGSATGPASFKVQYSLDGTNFTDLSTYAVTNDSWSATNFKSISNRTFDLTALTALNNKTAVYFRVVSTGTVAINGSAVGTGGTSRIDNFTVTGIACEAATAAITADGATSFCEGGSVTLTASEGPSYLWSTGDTTQSITVAASGNYFVQELSANGCGATSNTIAVTVTPNTSNTTTATACDSYVWSVNGQTYTASGNYTVVNGCSTENLNLTITPSTSHTTTITACDSYTWSYNDQEYFESGTYSVVTGCHTEILALTITPSTSHTTTISACDSYTWAAPLGDGQTYRASGTHTYTSGCHTETLVLTIIPSTNNVTTISACDSYTWSNTGLTYTTSGTYTGTTANCVTQVLNLTINTTPTVSNVFPSAYNVCDGVTSTPLTLTSSTSGDVTFDVTGGAAIGLNDLTDVTVVPPFTTTLGSATITITPKLHGCVGNSVSFGITVNPVSSNTTTITATGSYTWPVNNETYTASVNTMYSAPNSCHTEYLNLTIIPVAEITTQPANAILCSTVGATVNYTVASTMPNATYQWRYRVATAANPNPAWIAITSANAGQVYSNYTSATLTVTKTTTLPAVGTQYSVVISGDLPSLTSDVATVTVLSTPKGGTITSPTSVCLGSDITFTLTKQAGTSLQWQSSPISTSTAPGVFTDIPGATGTSYTVVGATADMDKSYRVAVYSECSNTTVYSPTKTIKVDPTSVAGNLTSGGGVVCAGSNGTLKVAGYVGKIQWEYSTDGENYVNAPKAADGQTVPFGTTSVSSTAATYLVTGIATELWFRARVTSGACSSSYTSAAHYTIGTAALVGAITPASTTLCPGTGTTLTLSGAVGVITWQKSTTWTAATPTWISSTNHTDTFATGNLTVSTAYRAMVTIGSCSTVYSDLAFVYVVAKPLAKTIVANTTTPSGKTALTAMCTNDASKILTVGAGSVGSVQWQWSTTSTTSGFTDIAGATDNSYVVTNPAVGANYFRVKMSNTCGVEVFGTAVTVWYKDCTPAKAEVKAPFNVVAYPNPYTANFNLSLTTSSVDTVGVSIYDMTGKLIDQRTVRPSEVSDLQVGDRYPSGVYNVVVTQGSEVKTLRVIKR